MKYKFIKAKDIILNSASKLFVFYKNYLLVFFILFLIAFITGIMTCSHYASSIDCEKLINSYLYSFLCRDSSYMSFFLILSVYFIIIAVLFFFITNNVFLVVVDIVVLILTSYILGFDLCVIIISLGLSGVIFGILIFGLFGILVVSILICILSISCKRIKERRRSCESFEKSVYMKLFFVFLLLGVAFLFLLCILLSIIHIFVIVE